MVFSITDEIRQSGSSRADFHIRSVPSIADRDRLATESTVRENDLVYVDATSEYFRRTATGWLLTDSTGQAVAPAGTTLLYVDPENGDDTADGLTSGTQLATIQEAINRFMPPSRGPILLASDEYLEIRVTYTPGMNPIAENIVKPAHRGPGQLFINADLELVEDALVESGAPALVSGHQGLYRVSFTTSPFVPSALQSGYFVTPDDDIVQAFSDNVAFIAGEHGCIQDNAADSVDVMFLSPGLLDAFSYANTAALRVVRPQIAWDPQDLEVTSFGPMPAQILNQGGPLVIKGFIFDRGSSSNPAQQQTLALDMGKVVGGTFQQENTTLTLCIFRNLDNISDASRSVMISSSFIDTNPGSIFFDDVEYLAFVRNVIQCDSELQFKYCRTVLYRSNYVFRAAGSQTKVQVLDCQNFACETSDFRTDVDLRMVRATFQVSRCSFEGMGNNAIRALDLSQGFVIDCIGSAGNLSHGLEVGDLSKVTQLGTNTLSGASGNVLVGATSGVAWGAGRTIDATTFSVFS